MTHLMQWFVGTKLCYRMLGFQREPCGCLAVRHSFLGRCRWMCERDAVAHREVIDGETVMPVYHPGFNGW